MKKYSYLLLLVLSSILIACDQETPKEKTTGNSEVAKAAAGPVIIASPWWGDMTTYTKPHPKTLANPEIQDFVNTVYNASPELEVKSFFINADTLRRYLNANKNVNHVQVLMGLREKPGVGKYRVYYIVGVSDATKKQVYFKDAED